MLEVEHSKFAIHQMQEDFEHPEWLHFVPRAMGMMKFTFEEREAMDILPQYKRFASNVRAVRLRLF